MRYIGKVLKVEREREREGTSPTNVLSA